MFRLLQTSLAVLLCTLLTGSVPAGLDSSASIAQQPPAQAPGKWSAGVARVMITPTEPIFLKGYGSRTKPSEGVRQDLYVKALALRDETGATSVLVTSDFHSYTRKTRSPTRCRRSTGCRAIE